ncbi:MAG: pitrilysin family protein [Planctomycetota bacterium]|nr:pitrilysin family protein [Planctomycetota bacterium]
MPARKKSAAKFVCLIALCLVSVTAGVRAETKLVTSVEGIVEFQLDNGMKVLLFPDESKPTVTVNVTYFVGSRHEGYGEAGMAHLLEHMLFKGTPTHPDVPKSLKDRGADFNGTTWLDRTNYYETLPGNADNLEFALKLESDRMINSNVAAEDLATEFSVVRNEFERGENSPTSVLWQRMVSAAFLWHNYGNSTIGNRADIERVPIENLRKFYRRYYQPDNALLVIAGKFDGKQALELTEKYFGSIARPERQLDRTYTQEPAQDGERFVTLRRVGEVAAVGAVYHIPAGPHPEYPAIDVVESMLTAQPAGRLYKELVEKKRASDVSGAAFALHDPGIFLLISEVNKGNEPQVVLEALIDVVESFGDSEISKEDVDRAKQRLLKQWELATADSRRLAIQLSEWAAQGDWRLYFLYRDRLEKVDVDQVRSVAKEYLRQNNRTVGMYLPIKEADRVSVPETPELAEMIGDYKGRKEVAAGEVFDVSPEHIEERTQRLTINGGLKVALLPKKNRGEAVRLNLTLRYGNEKSLQGQAAIAEFLPTLMTRGTKELDRQQLQDELDRNFAQLSGSGSAGEATFSITTRRANLARSLELLGEVLRNPTLPDTELGVLRSESVTALEQASTEPTALAQRAAQKRISPYKPGHPFYTPSVAEELEMVKAVTQQDVKRLYSEFLNGANGELSIVGDFDVNATLTQLQTILSGWKPERPFARIEKTGDLELKAETEDINTPDKANAMYFAVTAFSMKDDDPDYPALLMGNYIFGGGALSNRLGNRVRQKEGLSYGVRSGLSVSSLDPRTVFYVYAISNPANMAKVKVAIREELDLLREKGVTAEELESAKQGWLQSQAVSRGSDTSLAGTLSSTSQADRTMEYYSGLETKVRSVTAEQVLEVVQKYLDPERIVIVAAGDFEKATAEGPQDVKPEE